MINFIKTINGDYSDSIPRCLRRGALLIGKEFIFSGTIDQSGAQTFSASVELAFQKLKLPINLSLDEAAKAVVTLTANNPIAYTYDQAMHCLFTAIFEGFFKDKLFQERFESTEAEKERPELAQIINKRELPSQQEFDARTKIIKSYENLAGREINKNTDNFIEFVANPENLLLGLTTDGKTMHEEVRPTALKAIEESETIGLLHCYVEQFIAFFTTLQPLPSTFSELYEANPAAWKRLSKIHQ